MRFLVTGGAGFIGQHVVRQLVQRHGARSVTVLDARTRAATGWDAVQGMIDDQLWRGDVCDPHEVRVSMLDAQPDVVLHLAAQSHVDRSLQQPNEAMIVNGYGTQVVASACATAGVPLVYCSTDEVYGPVVEGQPSFEGFSEGSALNPSSPYSAGKAAGELAVRAMGTSAGLRYAITRGCNAWGEGQLGEKLVPIACALLQAGRPVPLHGGGHQLRQWIAVGEFADALCTVSTWLAAGRLQAGTTVNIAGPCVASVRQVVLALAERAGVPAHAAVVDSRDRPGQDRAYCVTGDYLRRLGWEARQRLLDPQHLDRLLAAYRGSDVQLASYVEAT
jgi:dTDP-glucose 4,6-dehydratase